MVINAGGCRVWTKGSLMRQPWLTVNLEGYANTLSPIERSRVIWDLVQNALDTDAKNIIVKLTRPRYGYAQLSVEDDDPHGFNELRLCYELFGHTEKRMDPTKAGRFTEGEKRFLALCRSAKLESTKGTIIFDNTGRHQSTKKRQIGSAISGEIEMDVAQWAEACAGMLMVIPHDGVTLIFITEDGEKEISHRQPMKVFKATLQTELASKTTQKMYRIDRETEVRLYVSSGKGSPHLYELGLPVVELNCEWHVDVRQRVPLNRDRDNVTPAYRQALLALVFLLLLVLAF